MAQIYIYNYNNYYNRQIKKADTIAEYGDDIYYQPLINFNPNDGVNTVLTVGGINTPYDGTGDYLLYCENNVIISRWFILEAARLRNNQYQVTLRRDVIADNYTEVLSAPTFVEKGYVADTNPLIFNNEQMGYNQVKTSETILENNLQTPWVICYLSRYHNADDGTQAYNEFKGSFKDEGALTPDYELSSLNNYTYYNWVKSGGNAEYKWTESVDFATYYNQLTSTGTKQGQFRWRIRYNGTAGTDYQGTASTNVNFLSRIGAPSSTNPQQEWQTMYSAYLNGYTTQNGLPINNYSGLGTVAGYNLLQAENGKIIKVGTTNAKYYRISTTGGSASSQQPSNPIPKNDTILFPVAKKTLLTDHGFTVTDSTVYRINVEWPNSTPTTQLVIEEISSTGIDYDITYTGAVTRDSVYEIIATPLKDTDFVVDKTGSQFHHVGDIGLQWFQDIINKYNGAGWAYDIQIVPYINFDSHNLTTQNVTYATRAGTKLAVALKLTSASFNYSKAISIPMRSNVKIGNEVDMYRFCSPNGIGSYEFNPYKNGGLTSYEADVTLVPFNPYIKVHPIFGGLYGTLPQDDFRGLVCGGDFSLPILNDRWSTYELNNKYYQQQFQRNIESQNYNNNWAMAEEIVGAVTGSFQTSAQGLMVGGAAGAIVGGVTGLGAGVADVVGNTLRRQEEIQRQKDQYGYQLGTIKAQANTLVRTTSYNISNKYFPYIEYYTATDTEVAALENKLKYNGMTINVIDTISAYIGPEETYIQGKPIRLTIADDAHLADAISYELQKGVYLT